jgi:hypothetical protein
LTKNYSGNLIQYVSAGGAIGTELVQYVGYGGEAGVPWQFSVYNGKCYASNGFRMSMFDGAKWHNQEDINTKYIAANLIDENNSSMVLYGTPHYPNEITYTPSYEDVVVNTQWTGTQKYTGGIGSNINLKDIWFSAPYYYVCGELG